MDTKMFQRQVDVELMANILVARQLQGDAKVTRRQMFDYIEPISPRALVAKQKLGVDFSNMLQDAAALVSGANFVFDTHANGKRKNVRVEFI